MQIQGAVSGAFLPEVRISPGSINYFSITITFYELGMVSLDQVKGMRLKDLANSPYRVAATAMLCFLILFYIHPEILSFLAMSQAFVYSLVFLRTLVAIVAIIALLHAYITVGGVEWIIWLAPAVIELAFWPRLLLTVLFQYYIWYPSWSSRALIYPLLLVVGFLLSRRRYLAFLRSASGV